jgi:hypothetical protein
MVDASAARAHLQALQAKGIGIGQAARLAGVGYRTVRRVRSGALLRIRAETSAAILAIRPALARGQRVNSYATRRLVRALELEGFTQTEIAQRLGLRGRRLRLHNGITVRNALRVRALWQRVSE